MVQVTIVNGVAVRRRRKLALLPFVLAKTGERVWLERLLIWEILDRRGRWVPWCSARAGDVLPAVDRLPEAPELVRGTGGA